MADNHAGPISGPQTGPQAGSQTGQQDITDYCRSCKASIADQKQIRVVTEWCCACVTKLIKNHRHLCEFDFAGKKSQCLHCREGNFSNAGKNPKPCVGPPIAHQLAASNLVNAAQTLCAAEVELADLQAKVSWAPNRIDLLGRISGCTQMMVSAKQTFESAANNWKTQISQYQNQFARMSNARVLEDKAAGTLDIDIFKKRSSNQHQINAARALSQDNSYGAGHHAKQIVDAFVQAEKALEMIGQAAEWAGSSGGPRLSQEVATRAAALLGKGEEAMEKLRGVFNAPAIQSGVPSLFSPVASGLFQHEHHGEETLAQAPEQYFGFENWEMS